MRIKARIKNSPKHCGAHGVTQYSTSRAIVDCPDCCAVLLHLAGEYLTAIAPNLADTPHSIALAGRSFSAVDTRIPRNNRRSR